MADIDAAISQRRIQHKEANASARVINGRGARRVKTIEQTGAGTGQIKAADPFKTGTHGGGTQIGQCRGIGGANGAKLQHGVAFKKGVEGGRCDSRYRR
ncbi:hypothetical protein JCM19000A_11740 [Silvimonas sp. JCM 19000]